MADSFIRVPVDSTGKRVDTEELTVGANTVQRERDQIAGAAAAEIAAVKNAIPASTLYGLITRLAPPYSPHVSPQMSTATEASIAAAGTSTLDSTQLNSGKTGHLVSVFCASSVPLKVELRTVSDGVASSNLAVWFTHQIPRLDFQRGFVSVAESAAAGLDGFRVVITNLDAAQTADVYATFLWDEE